MSVRYTWVQWNHKKLTYDAVMLSAIVLYLIAFVVGSILGRAPDEQISMPIVLIRALGTCAILLLTLILCIGPAARLDRRFLPLLYNRRHLGVATFIIALLHGLIVLVWYHGFGVRNPILSIFVSTPRYASFTQFPFEIFGVVALVILFYMAATSHDFWLKNLSPRIWKSLHMLVYFAYALLMAHIILGALQLEKHPAYVILTAGGAVLFACAVVGFHFDHGSAILSGRPISW